MRAKNSAFGANQGCDSMLDSTNQKEIKNVYSAKKYH